jgi:hypothetical protein
MDRDRALSGRARSGGFGHLRSHGAGLVGEVAQYEDAYRLCYVRGPEGMVIGIGLAEHLR